MVSELAARSCVPCHGGVPRLAGEELRAYAEALPDWRVVGDHHLYKAYRFPDFRAALAFTNRVGEIAEIEGHHPDILLAWGRAEITIYTHAIDGLSESDFILAAKINELS